MIDISNKVKIIIPLNCSQKMATMIDPQLSILPTKFIFIVNIDSKCATLNVPKFQDYAGFVLANMQQKSGIFTSFLSKCDLNLGS